MSASSPWKALLLIVLELGVLLSGISVAVTADTTVGTNITASTTWTLANSPYVVTSTITVYSGAALTIEPGVTVRFNAGQSLLFGSGSSAGTLRALGTTAQPIVLTAANGVTGGWGQLQFNSADNALSILRNVTVERGQNGIVADSWGTNLLLDNVTLQDVSGTGLQLSGDSDPTVRNLRVNRAAQYGIRDTNNGGTLRLQDVMVTGTTGIAVHAASSDLALTNVDVQAAGKQIVGRFKQDFTNVRVGGSPASRFYVEGHGITSGTTTVRDLGLPYQISSYVIVYNGATMAIEPGARLEFESGAAGLIMGNGASSYGTLQAPGTVADPIVLTASNGLVGSWGYLQFNSGDNTLNVLRNVTIERGQYGILVDSWGTNLLLDNVTIQDVSNTGLQLSGDSDPTVRNLRVNRAALYGIRDTSSTGTLRLTDTVITGIGVAIHASSSDLALTNVDVQASGKQIVGRFKQDFTNVQVGGLPPTRFYVEGHGITSGTTTVRDLGLPYQISSYVIVYNGATMAIEPGARLEFESGAAGLIMGNGASSYGTLQAPGTVADPIVLTASNGLVGSWGYLQFNSGDNALSLLRNVTVERGQYGILADNWGTNLLLDNVTIQDVSNAGLQLSGDSDPTVRNLRVNRAALYGVRDTNNGGTLRLQDTVITGYTGVAVHAPSSDLELTNVEVQASGKQIVGRFKQDFTNVQVGGAPPSRFYLETHTITSGTTTVRDLGIPYQVNGQIIAYNGATLTVQPGTRLEFEPGATLVIGNGGTSYGTLQAQGTAEDPIVLTASNGLVGSWGYLNFNNGDNALSVLRNVTIERGQYGIIADGWGTNLLLDNVTIQDVSGTGLQLSGDSDPTVRNLHVNRAAQYGIRDTNNGGTLRLQDTVVTGYTGIAVYAPSSDLALINVEVQAGGKQIVGRFKQDFTNVQVGGLPPSRFYVEAHGLTSGTTTVRELDLPYQVSGQVIVYNGAALTVQPGTRLEFEPGATLVLGNGGTSYGTLQAQGTVEEPILLTASNGLVGSWGYLNFNNGDNALSALRNVTIERGQYGIIADGWGTNLLLDNVTIQDVSGTGLQLSGDSDPTVRNLHVNRAAQYGIRDTNNGGTLRLQDTVVTGYTGIAVYAPMSDLALTNVEVQAGGKQIVGRFKQDFTNVQVGGLPPSRFYVEAHGLTSGTTTVRDLGLPYQINGQVIVYNGATLAVEPGTRLEFEPGATLVLGNGGTSYGTLQAAGTVADPIVFTASNGLVGSWGYLQFNTADNSLNVLRNVTVERGQYGILADNWGTNLLLDNVTLQDLSIAGLYLNGDSDPTVRNLHVNRAAQYGIRDTANTGTLRLQDTTVTGLGGVAVYAPFSNLALENVQVQSGAGAQIVGRFDQTLTNVQVGGQPAAVKNVGAVTLTANTVVPTSALPYRMDGSLNVNGVTLTIQPGVEIQFPAGATLSLATSGTNKPRLVADGTTAQPIILTGSAGTPGSWEGLQFSSTAASTASSLRHVLIEDARTAVSLSGWQPGLVLEDVTVHDATVRGIDTLGSGSLATATRLVVQDTPSAIRCQVLGRVELAQSWIESGAAGVELSNCPSSVVGGTVLAGNPTYGLSISSATTPINAESNYWGHASGPSGAGSGSGDKVLGNADYDPWLTAPGSFAPPPEAQAVSGPALGSITVSWPADAAAATYEVQRAPFRIGPFTTIATVAAPDTSYVDSGLYEDAYQYYRVIALDGNGAETSRTSTASAVPAITKVSGAITASTTWSLTNSPYQVTGPVYVQNGATLTIEPGVIVTFKTNAFLRIGECCSSSYGTLRAEGTQAEPILFTAANGAVGGWNYIHFYYADNQLSVLRNVTIEKGNFGIQTYDWGTNLLLDNVVIRDVVDTGLYLTGNSNPTVRGLRIERAGQYGVRDTDTGPLSLSDAEFVGSTGLAVYAPSASLALTDVTVENHGRQIVGSFVQDFTNVQIGGVAPSRFYVTSHDLPSGTTTVSDGLPYQVDGTVNVQANSILDVQPGVRIEFGSGTIQVGTCCTSYGTLRALGTEAEPIVFTSVTSQAGSWNGLQFYYADNQQSILRNVTIELGTNGIRAVDWGTNLVLDHVTIRDVSQRGLYLDGDSNPVVHEVAIHRAGLYGVYDSATGTLSLSDVQITGSSGIAIYATSSNLALTNVAIENHGRQIVGSFVQDFTNVQVGGVTPSRYYVTNYDVPSGTTTVRNLGLPYQVDGTVNVQANSVLDVQPGVRIEFSGGTIQVGNCCTSYGTLRAQGTEGNPIVFTSVTSQAGSWNGLQFYYADNQQSILRNVTVELGTNGIRAVDWGTNLVLDHVTIQDVSQRGLYLDGDSNPSVRNLRIERAGTYGVYDSATGTLALSDVQIIGSNGIAIYASSSNLALTDVTIENYGRQIVGSFVQDFNGVTVGGTAPTRYYVTNYDVPSGTTTVRNLGLPYQVDGTVNVQANSILDVQPGVRIEFGSGTIQVGNCCTSYGTLRAQGTQAEPIVFTSTTNLVGSWNGLQFYYADNQLSVLRNTTVELGTNGIRAVDWGTNLRLDNVTIRDVSQRGLYLDGDSNPTVRNLAIHRPGQFGVFHSGSVTMRMNGVTITGNTATAVSTVSGGLDLVDVDVSNGGLQILANFTQRFDGVHVGGAPATAKHVPAHTLPRSIVVETSDLPYHVLGDIQVPGPYTLTIQNGTRLTHEAGADYRFFTSGSSKPRLLVQGTQAAPVVFEGSTRASGEWDGLKFEATGIAPESIVRNATVEHAKTAFLVTGWQPRLLLDNVNITEPSVRAVDLLSQSRVEATALRVSQAPSAIRCQSLGSLSLLNSDIRSGASGVTLDNCGTSIITNTTFIDNPTVAVSATNSDIVDAEFNYWGHATGPSGLGAGLGDKALGSVDYYPWLQQPGSYEPLPDVAAPTSVRAVAGPALGAVTLNWTLPPAPTLSFGIYRSSDPRLGFALVGSASGSATTYQDTGLADGVHYYRVTSRNLADSEGIPSLVVGGSPPAAPAAPLDLRARRDGADVRLDWLAPAWNGGRAVTAFTIQSSTGDGVFSDVATVGPATEHSTPACSPECVYRVIATNELGSGEPSNEAAALPSYTDFPAESVRGTTPGAGGNLKDVFPCDDGASGAVNVVTGQLVASTCLFKAPSPYGLDVTIQATHRTHGSGGSLAPNWDLSVSRRIALDDNGDAVLFDGAGRADRFAAASAGAYTAPPGFYQRLTRQASGWFLLEFPGGLRETYDAEGNRVALRDALGNRVDFTHDAQGRPVQVSDTVGKRIHFVQEAGRLATIQDWTGRTVAFGYDAAGDLATVELRAPNSGAGPQHRFTYEGHLLANATAPTGATYLRNLYDGQGRVVNQTYGAGSFTRFEYDADGKRTRVTDPNGNSVNWTYLALDQPVPVSKALDRRGQAPLVTGYQSNADLEVTRVTMPKGDAQEWVYDSGNSNPLAHGNILSSTQRPAPGEQVAPLATTNTYEALYQGVKAVTNPLGNDPSYEPQNGGSSLGRYTTKIYYGQDEQANSQDLNGDGVIGAPAGRVVRVELPTANSEGVPIEWMQPDSGIQRRWETFEYNARGQVTKHTGMDGAITTYTYYGPGLQYPEGSLQSIKRTDSKGNPPGGAGGDGEAAMGSFRMAAAESSPQEMAALAPEGIDYEIVFTYDEAGNVERVASPGNRVTEFTHDEFGRTTSVMDGAGMSTTMAYDADGNLVAQNRTNAVQQPDGSFAPDPLHPVFSDRFVYDELGRVTEIVKDAARPAGAPPSDAPAELREQFVYDPNGNVVLHRLPSAVSGEDPAAVESFAYDERNQLVAQTSGANVTPILGTVIPAESTTLYLHAGASQVAGCPSASSLNAWEACRQGTAGNCPGGEESQTADGRPVCLPPSRHPQAKPGLVRAGSLPSARSGAAATWDPAAGKAYVVGGLRSGTVLDEVVEYDATTETVVVVGHLPSPRWAAASVFDGRHVYVFGGCAEASCGASTAQTVYRFDPLTRTVAQMRDLPEPVRSAAAVWDGHVAYVLGGCFGACDSASALRSVVRYDPATDEVATMPTQLPAGLQAMASAWDDQAGEAILLGGVQGGRTDQVLRFSVEDGSFQVSADPLDSPRDGMAAAWSGDAVYAFGGFDSARTPQIVRHDPGTDRTVAMTMTLPSPGYRIAAAWASDFGLLFGGDYATGGASNAVYKFHHVPEAPLAPHHPIAFPGPVTGQTVLRWEAPNATGSTELLSYNIYRRTAASDYALVGSVPASQQHFVDETSAVGETYSFAVSAENGDLEGPFSTEAVSVGTPEFPAEGPVQLCPDAGVVVGGNPVCPPVDECPANTIGAVVDGQPACATLYGCADGHFGVVVSDEAQCIPMPLCPPTSACPQPNQLVCYLPDPCLFILNGTLATHVGPDGIGVQVGGQDADPPLAEDTDGYAAEAEALAGSSPWRTASTPLSDDDGDGRANQLEAKPNAACTGAHGVVAGPGCGGYTNPAGWPLASTYPAPWVWVDGNQRVWVWDGVCLPAALDGDYATCKSSGNRLLSTTVYTGSWTGDGYGWRRVALPSDRHVEYYGPCGDIQDPDSDGIPSIGLCRNEVVVGQDGTVTPVSSTPWRTLGDPNPRPIVVYIPLWGLPYDPQPPSVDTDPQPEPEPPAPAPGWKWTYTLDEAAPGNSTAKGAPNLDEAPAHAAWLWTPPNGTFAFEERHIQLKFWALQAGDGSSVIANRWNARLYADDVLVATTNPEVGTILAMADGGVPQEYVIDLGTASFNGTTLRLELDLGATPAGRLALFDDAAFPSRLELSKGSTAITAYDENGDVAVQVDALGRITRFERDAFGRAANVTLPDGTRIANAFDPAGQPVVQERRAPIDLSAEDEGPAAAARASASAMDAGSVEESGGLLERKLRHFDEAGRLYRLDVALLDANGNPLPDEGLTPGDGYATTLYEYDAAGRLVRKTEDNFAVETYEYDGLGRLVREIDPLGNVFERSYDAAGNLANETKQELVDGPDGPHFLSSRAVYGYDALNQLVRITDPLGQTARMGYDADGRVAWMADERGPLEEDPEGLYNGTVNGPGNLVRFTYDGLGRLLATNRTLTDTGDSAGTVVGYVTTTQEWDNEGRLVRQVDGNGHATTYTYNDLGNLVAVGYADGSEVRYRYDANDNRIGWTDANGNVVRQDFDSANRITRRSVESGPDEWSTVQTLEYDSLGRLVHATDNNDPAVGADDSELRFTYDSLGRITTEDQDGRLVSKGYDGILGAARLTYANGRTVDYERDLLGSMTSASDATGLLRSWAYNGTRLQSMTSGNGVTSTFGYDLLKRPTSIEHGVGATPIRFEYAYDRAGQRVAEILHHAPSWSQQATYDSVGRLSSVSRSNFAGLPEPAAPLDTGLWTSAAWALDGASNWDEVTGVRSGEAVFQDRSYDAANALAALDGDGPAQAFEADPNGNRVSDGRHNYTWDAFNRLREVNDVSTGTPVASYTYDALGRRVTKAVDGNVTRFVYDGTDVIEERDGNGTLLRQFVHGSAVDQPILMDTDVDGDGIATGTADQRLYFAQDALGSVVALVDDAGNAVEGYLYDPYGTPAIIRPGANGVLDWGGDDAVIDSSAYGNPYAFTGQRFDAETGLHYYRARYYDPANGVFLSRDPIGVWEDEANLGNAYAYAGSDPLGATDPTGMYCWKIFSKSCQQENKEDISRDAKSFGTALAAFVPIPQTDWAREEVKREFAEFHETRQDLPAIVHFAADFLAPPQSKTEAVLFIGLSALGGVGGKLSKAGKLADEAADLAKLTPIKAIIPTATPTRVFYGGGPAVRQAALARASETGALAIDNTLGGRIWGTVSPYLPESVGDKGWGYLSKRFASKADGPVEVFYNTQGVLEGSHLIQSELPRLLNNPRAYLRYVGIDGGLR